MKKIKQLLDMIIPMDEKKRKKKHKPKQTIVRTYPMYLYNSDDSDTSIDTGVDAGM